MNSKRRSNRPLTQFACGCVDLFLSVDDYETDRSKGNTSVKCYNEDNARVFQVALEGQKILEAVFFNNQPITFCLVFSDKFKTNEAFRTIAIERINGLLDTFGSYEIIPDGVRVFIDREEGVYYLGKGDIRFAIKGTSNDFVLIDTDYHILKLEKLQPALV